MTWQGAPPAALTRERAQAAATAAAAERDAIQANLLDLDGSFGKRLLAGATLTGGSRKQWDTASAGLAWLWDTFTAYSAVIDKVTEIVDSGRLPAARLAEVTDLLYGPSVVLADQVAPLGQRELTAGAQRRLTAAGAVAAMKREFPQVAAVFTAAETVWNELSDGLRLAADSLATAKRDAAGLADDELAGALRTAEAGLDELRSQLNADPLAFWDGRQIDTTRLVRLREQADKASARAAAVAALARDAGARIAEVTAAVAAARQAWQDATAARARAAAKITAPPADPLPDVSALAGPLDGLAALQAAGRWTRLDSELGLVARQAEDAARRCRAAEQAAAGLLARRDELRGLLDAYRAKAGRRGGAEDTLLDARYQQAHDVLWAAPCDLAAATAAVTDYQQAILALDRR